MADKKELPIGWEIKKLGDVCKTTSGGTPSRKVSTYYEGDIPWVKSGELDKGIIYDTEEKITQDAVKNSSAKVFPKGTLLIALYGATIGKLAFLGVEAASNQAVCGIFENDKIATKYIYNYLFFNKSNLVKQGIGGAQPNISQTILKNLDVPIPPLDTQHSIVSKIEELFSELDKGIAELKLAHEQLKVYRQSVLKYAFEGRLTNDNLKEGKLPTSWEILKLGDFITNISSGKSYRCDERPPRKDEVGIVKVSSVTRGIFNQYESKTCFSKEFYNPKYLIEKGDFLFSRANTIEFIGACAIVDQIEKQLMLSDKILRFTFSKDLLKKYALYFLQSRSGRKQIETLSTGNQDSMRNIGQEKIKQILIPFCSLNIQKQVIREIESRLSVADKMDESIHESLQKAEALRQSILKKAFSGELVKDVKAIEIPKIKNEYLHQLQLVALVINGFKKKKIDHGEMTLAKNLYLLDSIYKIPTGFKYDRWHLGPYPPALKKVVNNKEYFKRNDLFIEATNDDKLQKYTNPYQDEVNNAINDLSAIFSKYKGAKRSHKTELLATVCKVIEDIKLTDLQNIRQSMAEWKIELKTSHFKNKAEKFNEAETEKCIAFIVERGWDRKLIH